MNGFMRALLAVFAGQCALRADPGAWNLVTFPVESAIVSAVAIERGRVAVGLTAGGVKLVDTGASEPVSIVEPGFGPKGRILSLAWFEGDLWIAGQKGLYRYRVSDTELERDQDGVPAGIRTGVKAMRTQGGYLMCATLRRLARLGPGGKSRYKEWFFPMEIDPTCVLRIAGRVIVGTATKGLFVLDTASERWVRYGSAEGLASDQIAALEWMGDQVLVGTSEGIDALDLSNLTSRHVV